MTRAIVLTGTGRYDDPWHDFAATSHQIAATLETGGIRCEIRGTKRRNFADLADADLLIVNCGVGWGSSHPEDDSDWAQAHQALAEFIASPRPIIGIHTASNTFHGVPGWYERLGVVWEAGRSMHPPIGPAKVEIGPDEHPIVAGLEPFELFDERYSQLHVAGGSSVLATHDLDGSPQPLVVARENAGRRTVYDALGHGQESYRSAERRRLLLREAFWALGADKALSTL
jgi:hypothetical protein